MICSGCPNRWLDDCLVREAYVRSRTALDTFSLEGQFPESKVKGEPADFSPMTEYAWYEWVKFRETSVDFPDSKIQLIRDLGTVIDIGPATAHTVLNVKGKIMYHTPIRSLTSDEIQSSSETRA
jgi:hypothetical protein